MKNYKRFKSMISLLVLLILFFVFFFSYRCIYNEIYCKYIVSIVRPVTLFHVFYYIVLLPVFTGIFFFLFILNEQISYCYKWKLDKNAIFKSVTFFLLYFVIVLPFVTKEKYYTILNDIARFFLAKETNQLAIFLPLCIAFYFLVNGILEKQKRI